MLTMAGITKTVLPIISGRTKKKDAEIYTDARDLFHDLAVLQNDYTALRFNIIEIKRK